MTTQHTPGPWHVGCQNDALFVTAGREPALNNDHPWHDAPRVALCKVFGPSDDDCLPVDAEANARLMAAAPKLLGAARAALQCLDDRKYPAQARMLTAAIAQATGEPK